MFELRDEQSGKVKKVGTEKECLLYTKDFPNRKFILVDLEEEKKKDKNNNASRS